jgi:RecB family endonuclease NucS
LFEPRLGISDINKAYCDNVFVNEAHLEASVLANPNLLPPALQPSIGDTICRQVPISPFKPAQMDRADICYYNSQQLIRDGTIPNVVIELKNKTADQAAVKQVIRYLDWLYRIAGKEAAQIKVYLFAPTFRRAVTVEKYPLQIELVTLQIKAKQIPYTIIFLLAFLFKRTNRLGYEIELQNRLTLFTPE